MQLTNFGTIKILFSYTNKLGNCYTRFIILLAFFVTDDMTQLYIRTIM